MLSAKARLNIKLTLGAFALGALLKIEMRDLYQKGQWEVRPLPEAKYKTGDVLLICNRWFALPTVGEKLYSFACKAIMRSAWDDCAVIVSRDGHPFVLHADYDRVRLRPLAEFVDDKLPRGMAIRQLEPTHSLSPLIALREENPEWLKKVESVVSELETKKTVPWTLVSAAWLSSWERKHFAQAVALCQQDERVHKLKREKHTQLLMDKETSYLQDLAIVEADLRSRVNFSKLREEVTPGAVVAEFLARLGFLMSPCPILSKYLPCDFCANIPTLDSKLGPPRVVFKM
jgi:hypothetical protein